MVGTDVLLQDNHNVLSSLQKGVLPFKIEYIMNVSYADFYHQN